MRRFFPVGLLLFLSGLFIGLGANAQALEIGFGAGVFTRAPSISDVKYLSLAEDWEINDNVYWKITVGGWVDNRPDAHHAFHAGPSIGLVVRPWILDCRVDMGIHAISHTDGYLGGYWQAVETLNCGITEGRVRMGLRYEHFSSAGVFMPNRGRDGVKYVVSYEI